MSLSNQDANKLKALLNNNRNLSIKSKTNLKQYEKCV